MGKWSFTVYRVVTVVIRRRREHCAHICTALALYALSARRKSQDAMREREDSNAPRAFFSPRMLNLMANMVSHIKRVARPNKPFRIVSKYLGWSKLLFSCVGCALSTRARGLRTTCVESHWGDHIKSAHSSFSGDVGHYRSSFYATFCRDNLRVSAPTFSRRYRRPTWKLSS